MKTIKITIESESVEDGSRLAALIGGTLRKLGVYPDFPGADLGVVGRLIADDYSLNQELGQMAKADENGVAGFAATVQVTQPAPAKPAPTTVPSNGVPRNDGE